MLDSVFAHIDPGNCTARHQLFKIVQHKAFAAADIQDSSIVRKVIIFFKSSDDRLPAAIVFITAVAILPFTVKELLAELFGDPDRGLLVKESLVKRLRRQKAAVARGERGERLEDVARRLGLG